MGWKKNSRAPGPEQVAIVIPAHMGSKRFPGKPLAEARGKPLLQWAWEAAVEARCAGLRTVATDSEEIHAWCREHDINCLLDTRVTFPTGSDRVAAAVGRHSRIRYAVNLQCDEPELTGLDLDWLIAELQIHKFRLTTTFAFASSPDSPTHYDSNAVKVVTDKNHQAMYFSRASLGGARIHVGVYAYRLKSLNQFAYTDPAPLEQIESLEQLRLLHLGLPIHVVDLGRRVVSINTPEDLKEWNARAMAS